MKRVVCLLVVCLCGCTMITNDRVFPKLTWYWTDEAKQQRQSNKEHATEMKAYKESQQKKETK